MCRKTDVYYFDKVINYPNYFKQIVRPKFNFEELIVDGNKESISDTHM